MDGRLTRMNRIHSLCLFSRTVSQYRSHSVYSVIPFIPKTPIIPYIPIDSVYSNHSVIPIRLDIFRAKQYWDLHFDLVYFPMTPYSPYIPMIPIDTYSKFLGSFFVYSVISFLLGILLYGVDVCLYVLFVLLYTGPPNRSKSSLYNVRYPEEPSIAFCFSDIPIFRNSKDLFQK